MKYERYLYRGKFPNELPEPQLIVLYNGRDDIDFSKEHKLSDLFYSYIMPKFGRLELTVKYVDIRHNNVVKSYSNCESLYQYSRFVELYEMGRPLEGIVEHFDESSILGKILRKEGVFNMVNTEFSAKSIEDILIEQGIERGIEKGIDLILKFVHEGFSVEEAAEKARNIRSARV